MAKAYLNNPQLGADRARQRATDEKVPQGRSGWRPTIGANAGYGVTWSKTRTRVTNARTGQTSTVKNHDERGTGGFSINLNQPVFVGFKTVNSMRQAEATVDAGRQTLLGVEQTILLDAVTAYMNVFRDRNIVVLRLKNLEALKEQVRASRARFDLAKLHEPMLHRPKPASRKLTGRLRYRGQIRRQVRPFTPGLSAPSRRSSLFHAEL
ncbi:MAG: TolC family protein [Hyphomicrobiales bacterium]